MKKTVKQLLSVIIILTINGCGNHLTPEFEIDDIHITPIPMQLELSEEVFIIDEQTLFVQPSSVKSATFNEFVLLLSKVSGNDFTITENGNSSMSNIIALQIDETLNEEQYSLKVTQSTIVIKAAESSGFQHGIQTLRQLLPAAIETGTNKRI